MSLILECRHVQKRDKVEFEYNNNHVKKKVTVLCQGFSNNKAITKCASLGSSLPTFLSESRESPGDSKTKEILVVLEFTDCCSAHLHFVPRNLL